MKAGFSVMLVTCMLLITAALAPSGFVQETRGLTASANDTPNPGASAGFAEPPAPDRTWPGRAADDATQPGVWPWRAPFGGPGYSNAQPVPSVVTPTPAIPLAPSEEPDSQAPTPPRWLNPQRDIFQRDRLDGVKYLGEPPAGPEDVETSVAGQGADTFGYTWTDAVPFTWIDVSSGANSGLGMGNQGAAVTQAIDLGFEFKFYEQVHAQIYISTAGVVGFEPDSLQGTIGTRYLPAPARPNDFIAPYLAPLLINSGSYQGQIYYQRGGTEPDRYFVVEWLGAKDAYGSSYTFEVVLRENGDILFQYLDTDYGNVCDTAVGIEGPGGVNGLAFRQADCNDMHDLERKAILFERPPAAARVTATPRNSGKLIHAGALESLSVVVFNSGDAGPDTFDLQMTSPWQATAYADDGATPLMDTDGNGAPDTGSLPPGESRTVVVKVQAPISAAVGASSETKIVFRSSLDAAKSATVSWRLAVPAAFAQVSSSDPDGTMQIFLAKPEGQYVDTSQAGPVAGEAPVVAELANKDFLLLWTKYRYTGSWWVKEIWYSLEGPTGTPRTGGRLVDHGGATRYIYDWTPVIAVTPDGHIGMVWGESQWNDSEYNDNIVMAVLDATGKVIMPPTSLTNNTSRNGGPSFSGPQVAATEDNRFIIVWGRASGDVNDYVADVYLTVRNSSGGEVSGVTPLTHDTAGYDEGYVNPSLDVLAGSRALLTYQQQSSRDLFYGVLNSSGEVIRSPAKLVDDGRTRSEYDTDAVQLAGGRVLAAWFSGNPGQLTYAVFDQAYNVVARGNLTNPATMSEEGWLSVTADAAGHAVLTWSDYAHFNLYYALVDSTGQVLSPPQIFRSAADPEGSLRTSYYAYGNTTFGWAAPNGVSARIIASAQDAGSIGGYGSMDIELTNEGGRVAHDVTLEATLLAGLTYVSDTSQVTPLREGNHLRWRLPALGFKQERQFDLQVKLPSTSVLGAHLPISLTLTSTGPELSPADNSVVSDIVAGLPAGGPDDYGYVSDDKVVFKWIDARQGEKATVSGTNAKSRVDIGFPFKFYEREYSDVSVNTYGTLEFVPGYFSSNVHPLPSSAAPNNLIAPFWKSLAVGEGYNTGAIYTLRGGEAPHRYFVVEWYRVTPCCTLNSSDYKTFEAILHENGDIVVQYLEGMTGSLGNFEVGIEDDTGLDGLSSTNSLAGHKALRYFRPDASARVKLYSPYQGEFTRADAMSSFVVPIRNSGNIGSDTYDLEMSSVWNATLWAEDGKTALGDSDHDGVIDTGAVAAGEGVTFTVKVQTPQLALNAGNNNLATVTVRSTLDPAKSKVVTLQSTVPAPFVQISQEQGAGWTGPGVYLVRPRGQKEVIAAATAPPQYFDVAVAETHDGGFINVLSVPGCLRADCSVYGYTLEYTMLAHSGRVVRPPTKLAGLASATANTYDIPSVTVAPDGTIGIVWVREQRDRNWLGNFNVYYATLDAAGNLLSGPINVTDNAIWGAYGDFMVPTYYTVRITSAGADRYMLAWSERHNTASGPVEDIYYTVRAADGSAVRGITKLTSDTAGWDEGYSSPALVSEASGEVVCLWQRQSDGDVYYALLDATGTIVKPATNLVADTQRRVDYSPDAVQLANGKTLVAWTSDPVINPGEQGWTAQYYNNPGLSGPPVLERHEESIAYDWYEAAPGPGVNADQFSVRWTGDIAITQTGFYSFRMSSDDGSRLWIDDRPIMDHWEECCTQWTARVFLPAGVHRVRMEMVELNGWSSAHLNWSSAGGRDIRYALLDQNYNRVGVPRTLANPAAPTGNDAVSVTADGSGRGVITWMDAEWSYRRHLYYALVDGDGVVRTQPMIYATSTAAGTAIATSGQGQGNTSYSWQPASGVDGVVAFGATDIQGPAGSVAPLMLHYRNDGLTTATAVTLTASLDEHLSFVDDSSELDRSVEGNMVTWALPDLSFFDEGEFTIRLGVHSDDLGASYPVTVTLTSAGAEAKPEDNAAVANVNVSSATFMPMQIRRVKASAH